MPYKDPEKIKEYQKKYREANRDKLLAQNRHYYNLHKDDIKKTSQAYRDKNRDKLNENSLAYYRKNQEIISQKRKNRWPTIKINNRANIILSSKKYFQSNKRRIVENQKLRRQNRASWFLNIKKNTSCSCGEKHPATLDFHHLYDKQYLISRMVRRPMSEIVILHEISKCIVLCANCHRKTHYLPIVEKEDCCITQTYRYKRAAWFRDLKSKLRCKQCGEDNPATIDFHHRDRIDKINNVSKMVCSAAAESRILDEIKKCDPLCANCHRKLHRPIV